MVISNHLIPLHHPLPMVAQRDVPDVAHDVLEPIVKADKATQLPFRIVETERETGVLLKTAEF